MGVRPSPSLVDPPRAWPANHPTRLMRRTWSLTRATRLWYRPSSAAHGSEDGSPGLEENQGREAGIRPHRLWGDGLHRPSYRRISGDVLSRRGCSVLGDRGTLDR